MSNRSKLFEYVAGLSEDAAGAALVKIGATDPVPAELPLTDDPDANGAVAMPNVTNASWSPLSGARFIFKEIADSLPPGSLQRATAEINEGEAMSRWNLGVKALPGFAANECEQYADQMTGLPGFRVKPVGPNGDPANIPHVTAVPPVTFHGFNLATAQGLTDFLNWVPVSSTSVNPDFSPHH
jgi:hypothetical protein